MKKNILLIEDNADIANLITVNLCSQHMQVDHVPEGESGLDKALKGDYQLVILDLMLPGIDGMDICRIMRSKNIYTPVLMVTAKVRDLSKYYTINIIYI